jgi:hypothetical protein
MKRLLKYLGFTTKNGEYGSARKLTAFAFVIFAAYLHYKHAAAAPASFLLIDVGAICVMFGLTTYEKLTDKSDKEI